jgi:hypothetical protein
VLIYVLPSDIFLEEKILKFVNGKKNQLYVEIGKLQIKEISLFCKINKMPQQQQQQQQQD